MRVIALFVLIAVLPSAELGEQVVHFVEHAIEHDIASVDHGAHHDDRRDEHGCTGLVHLCGVHHAQITLGIAPVITTTIVAARAMQSEAPSSLADLTVPEPAQRPPIA